MKIFVLMASFLAVSVASHQAQSEVLFEVESEHCAIHATADAKWHVIGLRMTHNVVGASCDFSEEESVEIVEKVLDAGARGGDLGVYNAFRIGDIEDYAWMRKHLMDTAREDPNWVEETGRPKSGDENSYVDKVLSDRIVMNVFNRVDEGHGVQFTKMSCEKVFISEDGLPMDAHCWAEFEQK